MPLQIQESRDVIVAGGGPAGVIAAIAAARNGARTLLIEQNSYVGGTAVTGLPLLAFHNNRGEQIVRGIPWELVSRLSEMNESAVVRNIGVAGALGQGGTEFISQTIPVRPEAFKFTAHEMLREAGAEVMLHTFVSDVLMKGRTIGGLGVTNKSGQLQVAADIVIDCTGDGDVASMAGSPSEKGRSVDGLMQPMTMLFVLTGVDLAKAEAEGVALRREMEVMEPETWKGFYEKYDIQLTKWVGALQKKFPHSGLEKGFVLRCWGDGVYYAGNMLHIPYLDASKGDELSQAVTEGRNLIWGLVQFLRKNVPGFRQTHLIQTFNIGIRETRRILGDHCLTYEEVIDAVRHEDDIVLNGYFVDIHDYHGSWLYTPGKGTQVKDNGSYGIPYRCLLPRDVEHLLVAGRCLSASHEAHASARVMGTCMGMGQAAGTAAALSVKHGVAPRELDTGLLQKTLEEQGAIIR